MKNMRKLYGIGAGVFLGAMLLLSVYVWYQRAVNTPVAEFVYPHQGTVGASQERQGGGESYRLCLPADVLHRDARGTFVYVIEERQGVLGNTCVAIKRRVDVLASDDALAAVEGNLTAIDQVISASDRELYDGCPILREE